jgi:geranylgeranyl pyrophosphate synthase
MQREPSARDLVATVLRDGNYERVPRAKLRSILDETGCLDEARSRASEFAESSRSVLLGFPQSDYCEALKSIPSYVIQRDY